MFNREIKQRFIEEKKASTQMPYRFAEREFEKMGGFEEMYGKDIFDFGSDEITNAYKTIGYKSLELLTNVNSLFSQYTSKCAGEGLVKDNQNHFAVFTRQQMIDCLNNVSFNNSIVTKRTIYEWCCDVLNDADAFVILCLFEGICGKGFSDIYYASMDQIDGEKLLFHTHSGRTVPISQELYNTAKVSNECLSSMSYKGYKEIALIENDRIIKRFAQQKETDDPTKIRHLLYFRLSRCLNYLGVWNYINANDIIMSGYIDSLNQICKERGISGKEGIYDNEIREYLNEKFDKTIPKSTFVLKYSQFLVK